MARKNKRWIQKAKIKKGALHQQLAITGDIPVTLLKKIKTSKTGTTITNPTKKFQLYILFIFIPFGV